ncbi:penicillin-binding protein 1C [Fulvivirgaceae bacterium PWU5]|uniref:peptidoglycan glycosyltransferase n=1 Tax=Dawidia cretensis TaxID=2782350 RepID=A0AAP2DYD3_9BACT|nr:penicillin-binding protein 1C [Dawidia cretensis]MBT1709910.1 penicillin-binding protein 1C [Dawidia cretensis]
MSRGLKWKISTVLLGVALVVYYFSLPATLFTDPYSTVLESARGDLLSAAIAPDGQWRFPETDTVPEKFTVALMAYEDKRFRSHPGVDVLSLGRAFRQNLAARRVVSGGSTLTMQVIRLARKGEGRTVGEKLIEIILATRLEWRHSKDAILALYASHAPFGGNVVGIDAACWRYFGRDARSLSWSEAALLAVLPNAPALIHPGRNRAQLKAKRDWLLEKLRDQGHIDAFTCQLAQEEPIPEEPLPLPRNARHLLARMQQEGLAGHTLRSTLDQHVQQRVEQIIQDHHQRLLGNQIHHGAAIVAEVATGRVLAYVGNVSNTRNYRGDDVDVARAPRSTGSILKPFLFAASLEEGKILPGTLLPDIPIFINGFTPKNFSKDYDGAVAADRALIRSLNVPAVNLLRNYRYEKFHTLLKDLGMTTLQHPPDHYGLSLILGGAEGTLWDITGMYASLARTLNRYFTLAGANKYILQDIHPLTYRLASVDTTAVAGEASSVLDAASIYQTFDALKEVYRPGEESGWRYFNSAKKIAWKTGTSFGFRDGWAVGVTPDYVVGVWVGNADGEGRPGLTGTDAAAPVMFDIFSQLPGNRWFARPEAEMTRITVCAKSGYRNSPLCDEVATRWVHSRGLQTGACPLHRRVHLSGDRKYRVHSNCEPVDRMVDVNWFVLPPAQEYYFRPHNVSYRSLPPFRKDCQPSSAVVAMDLIYPKPGARIYIPRDLNGQLGDAVFELAHRNPQSTVFWHLDGEYLGSTQRHHHLTVRPGQGKHILTIMDESGDMLEQRFEVLSKM